MYKSFSRSNNNYSFFHTYFRSLYPSMYEDLMDNISGDDSSVLPVVQPTTTQPQPEQKEERSLDEISAANKVRVQDRIDGNTTINGIVAGAIPQFKAGTTGVSSSIHKVLTGYGVKQDPLIENNPTLSLLSGMNEKAHEININALIESKGQSGGVGMLYDPISNTFHGVSLSVKDMSEGASNFVEKLTGSSTGKRRNFVGKVPDVAVFKGEAYDTRNAKDYLALMDAFEAEAKNVYANYSKILQPTTDENQVDLTASTVTPTTSNETTGGNVGTGYVGDPGTSPTDYGVEATQKEDKDNRPETVKPNEGSGFVGDPGSNPEDYFDDEDYVEEGRRSGGFIGGMNPDQVTDAQTVADDYPIDSDDGDFMINAAAIEKDPQMFNQIISQGLQKAREKGVDVGEISGVGMDGSGDVLASKGEFLVKKPLAETIGYDALNQFNDQGKPEVDRRVAASGGFLDGYANGGDINLPKSKPSFKDRGEVTLNRLYNSVQSPYTLDRLPTLRNQIEKYIKEMPEENVLALASIIEGSQLGDRGMEAVMHIINNRSKSNYKDFSSINSIVDAVVHKTSEKGAFQFTAFEPNKLVNQLDDMMYSGYGRKKYQEQIKIAKDVISGKRSDFTDGALFYWNPYKATSSPIYKSIDEFKNEVKKGNVLMTYQIGSGNKMHQMFRPKDAEYPEKTLSLIDTPEPKPEQFVEKNVQEEIPSKNTIAEGKTLTMDSRGMLGTYLSNRAKPFLSMQRGS